MGDCVNDDISEPFQCWMGEGTSLKACQPAAERSPDLIPFNVFLLGWLPVILFLEGCD